MLHALAAETQELTMSSPLTLIVLGQAFFLGTVPNNPLIGTNSSSIPYDKSEPIESQPTPNLVRRADYTYTPGVGAHKIHSTATTWNKARMICEKEGAYLAIINSLAESQAIAQLFPASLPHINSISESAALIGFHDLYREGQYVTIHGESLEKAGFNEWNWGEPNNQGSGENCGSVWSNGMLNDVLCDALLAFVCELSDGDQDTAFTEQASASDDQYIEILPRTTLTPTTEQLLDWRDYYWTAH